MRIVDLKIIPKESAKRRFLHPGTLDRFELSRSSVTAVFVSVDGKTEDRRTLTLEPSGDCIHLIDEKNDVDGSLVESILDFWASMVEPADAELMRQQLGLVIKEARESLEAVELPDEGADT